MSSKFSRIGFVFAMAGSAVGLGNAWKFPTLVGQNGGSAFVLLYLLLTLSVGFVVFLAELSIGKLSEKDPVNAYKSLAPRFKRAWGLAGFACVGGLFIVSYYMVVIGWIVKYFVDSFGIWGFLEGSKAGEVLAFRNLASDISASGANFSHFLSADILTQMLCFAFVFFFVFYIVSHGVKNGIERFNVWMMPALFVILLFILIYAAFMGEGFKQALNFLFVPDFSEISANSVLLALGLAFFSMSLGVGTVITYSASLPDGTNFIKSTFSIILINVLIGLMMGLIVFTFIFAYGGSVSTGPGLIFVSLATLFAKLGFLGNVLACAFFIALFFAGATSAVSIIEPFAFYLINTFGMSRRRALSYIGVVVFILGSLCVLSSNDKLGFTLFGKSFFDVLDFTSSNIIMPIGGICAAIFVGFVLKKQALQVLFAPYMSGVFFEIWYIFLRYISPLAVAIVMVNNFYPLQDVFNFMRGHG